MRLTVTSVRPPGCLKGVVVCNFFGDDGTIGVVLQLDPVHARATAASMLRCAAEAEPEIFPANSALPTKGKGA